MKNARERESRAIELTQFEAALARVVSAPTTLRPFVCDGSPPDCESFIVGANAATVMGDFWDFWHSGIGMDKATWFEAYKADRAQQPLRAGKTRRLALSPTRRNIDLVVEGASPFRCLETNVFSVASSTTALLKPADRTTAVFEFLLQTIKPRVVLAHGAEGPDAVRGLDIPASVELVPHLSRGWSGERARQLGERLRMQLCTAA